MIHGAGWLGSRALAGQVPGGAPTIEPPRPTVNLTIYVAGTDRTGSWDPQSLEIREELGGRGQCSFRLIDRAGLLRVAVGQPVHVYYRSVLIFAGTIDDFQELTPDNDPTLFIDVSCVDWNQLADRHVVAIVYENKTLRQIVTDIIDNQSGDTGERLANDGVTYTSESITNDWTTIQYAAFDYEFASDCFDELAELTGYSWWIDYEKVFHMHEPDKFQAPVALDDDLWQVYTGLKHSQDRQDYRNVQYLRGGKAKTEPVTSSLVRTMSFKGDGETKSFTLDLEVASKPKLYIDSGSGPVEISQTNIAVRERDDSKEWYYALGEKEISQNTSDDYTALTSSQTLTVKWQGYYPIIELMRDEGQIGQRKAVEGGTGIYCAIEEDEKIDDASLARERTQGILETYGRIPQRLEWHTTTHGFHAGQLIQINIGRHDAVGAYIVDSLNLASFSEDAEQPFHYVVRATFQQFRGNWIRFFKKWIRVGRPWVINENDTVQTYRSLDSEVVLSDAIFSGGAPKELAIDWLGWAAIGRLNLQTNVPECSRMGYEKEYWTTYGTYRVSAFNTGGVPTGPLYGPPDEYKI